MTTARCEIDPTTTEVIRYALIAVAEEMKLTLMRSARNPIIYEVLDFSCGIFDRRGTLAAQASGLSIFLGTLDWAVQAVLRKAGKNGLRSGDVFLTNDPYGGGGTHLNDVCVVTPVFVGGELVGFTGSRAHWTDIGGAAALSVQPDAPNIHAEGLVLPVIRLYRSGQAVQEVVDLLRANVRDPERQLGDLRAQLVAAEAGAALLRELVDRYGAPAVAAAVERIQEQAESAVRARVRSLPNGSADADEYLDDDGHGGDPVRVHARLEICDDEVLLDFQGSDPATSSGYNMSFSSLVSACRVIFKAIVDPVSPANDGSFRALRVSAPAGSVVNAIYPSAVSLYGEPARRAIDAVWRAFASLVPEAIPAGHYGTIAGIAMAGYDDRYSPARWITFQGPNVGGWGAGRGHDGESALICITNGDTRNTPVEMIEHIAPLRVHALRLRDGSGGAGQWRGGLGIECHYEVLTGGPLALTCALGRTTFAPFGAAGGDDGATNIVEVWRKGREVVVLARVTAFPLEEGDSVLVRTGGGGGYGDPAERDPLLAELDARRGYVMRSRAVE
jgi:N-methylhydantoinase B